MAAALPAAVLAFIGAMLSPMDMLSPSWSDGIDACVAIDGCVEDTVVVCVAATKGPSSAEVAVVPAGASSTGEGKLTWFFISKRDLVALAVRAFLKAFEFFLKRFSTRDDSAGI